MADEKQTAAIVKVKEEVRLTSWQSEYEEMRHSGMTVKEWCAQRGISQSGFYHRLRRIREYMCGRYISADADCDKEEQAVVPIRNKADFGIVIESGNITVKIKDGISPQNIEAVIGALRKC